MKKQVLPWGFCGDLHNGLHGWRTGGRTETVPLIENAMTHLKIRGVACNNDCAIAALRKGRPKTRSLVLSIRIKDFYDHTARVVVKSFSLAPIIAFLQSHLCSEWFSSEPGRTTLTVTWGLVGQLCNDHSLLKKGTDRPTNQPTYQPPHSTKTESVSHLFADLIGNRYCKRKCMILKLSYEVKVPNVIEPKLMAGWLIKAHLSPHSNFDLNSTNIKLPKSLKEPTRHPISVFLHTF